MSNFAMATAQKCPICGKQPKDRSENRFFPFCTERCRTVDLGKWLGEEYRMPTDSADEQEDEMPTVPGDENAEEGG